MLKTIEIDIDVYKLIESERKDFEETQNDILRRLLNVDRIERKMQWGQVSNKMVLDLEGEADSTFYPESVEESEDITGRIAQYQRSIMEHRLNALINEPLKDWIFEGVRLPEGTKLRKWYRGQQYYALIANGSISFGDKLYYAPSSAAMAITNGSPVNGWLFWEYFDEADGSWKKLTELRVETVTKMETAVSMSDTEVQPDVETKPKDALPKKQTSGTRSSKASTKSRNSKKQ